jgi:hypothetical protein
VRVVEWEAPLPGHAGVGFLEADDQLGLPGQ